jgi:hypothetical protein
MDFSVDDTNEFEANKSEHIAAHVNWWVERALENYYCQGQDRTCSFAVEWESILRAFTPTCHSIVSDDHFVTVLSPKSRQVFIHCVRSVQNQMHTNRHNVSAFFGRRGTSPFSISDLELDEKAAGTHHSSSSSTSPCLWLYVFGRGLAGARKLAHLVLTRILMNENSNQNLMIREEQLCEQILEHGENQYQISVFGQAAGDDDNDRKEDEEEEEEEARGKETQILTWKLDLPLARVVGLFPNCVPRVKEALSRYWHKRWHNVNVKTMQRWHNSPVCHPELSVLSNELPEMDANTVPLAKFFQELQDEARRRQCNEVKQQASWMGDWLRSQSAAREKLENAQEDTKQQENKTEEHNKKRASFLWQPSIYEFFSPSSSERFQVQAETCSSC